jgi:hypothetical protein
MGKIVAKIEQIMFRENNDGTVFKIDLKEDYFKSVSPFDVDYVTCAKTKGSLCEIMRNLREYPKQRSVCVISLISSTKESSEVKFHKMCKNITQTLNSTFDEYIEHLKQTGQWNEKEQCQLGFEDITILP